MLLVTTYHILFIINVFVVDDHLPCLWPRCWSKYPHSQIRWSVRVLAVMLLSTEDKTSYLVSPA